MFFNRNSEVKLKPKILRNASFHQAVGPCLVYGQLYGMMPVNGVMTNDEKELEFRWFSLRTIYAIAFIFCGSADSFLGVLRLMQRGFGVFSFEALIFFALCVIRAVIFFHLATKWKKIIAKWRKCEEPFLSSPYEVKGWSLSRRVRVSFGVLGLSALCN